jgi:hypothetical protein
MNQKTTKRQALGTSLSALMRTSATTQLDRRAVLIDRLRLEVETLRQENEELKDRLARAEAQTVTIPHHRPIREGWTLKGGHI